MIKINFIELIRSLFKNEEAEKLKVKIKELEDKLVKVHEEKYDITNRLEALSNSIYKEAILSDELILNNKPYRGKRLVFIKDKIYEITFKNIQSYYTTPKELLKSELAKANISPGSSKFTIVTKILNHVQNKYSYNRDFEKFGKNENWENILNVITVKKADCESLSMLTVMLCREAGIPANRIFMACGEFVKGSNKFGHGWVIFKNDNGRWYVGEATTSSAKPLKMWKDLKDNYLCKWGISNDVHSCKLKDGTHA